MTPQIQGYIYVLVLSELYGIESSGFDYQRWLVVVVLSELYGIESCWSAKQCSSHTMEFYLNYMG